jgi:hypothetical protein
MDVQHGIKKSTFLVYQFKIGLKKKVLPDFVNEAVFYKLYLLTKTGRTIDFF